MRSSCVSILCGGLAAVAAQAAVVPTDGTIVDLAGTSAAAQPWLAGTVVEDELVPYAYTLDVNGSGPSLPQYALSGFVQSRVVKAVDGSFDFYWRILPKLETPYTDTTWDGPVSGVATWPVQAATMFTVTGFDAATLRADWRRDGLGDAAPQVVSAVPGTLRFGFAGTYLVPDGQGFAGLGGSPLYTDQTSVFMFLDTDAKAYAKTGSFAVSALEGGWYGGFGDAIPTFAPAPVPEPSTWALMLGGLAAVGFAARRRKTR